MPKNYSFPEKYQAKIESALQSLGHSLLRPQDLREGILELSDFYQQKSKTTPWNSPKTQAAYLAYFFPLNYVRNLKLFDELLHLDFKAQAGTWVDFGFGLGSCTLAAYDTGFLHPEHSVMAVDIWQEPWKIFETFFKEPSHRIQFQKSYPQKSKVNGLLCSYALNELAESESRDLLKADQLVLIEPSTKWSGRNLMKTRDDLRSQSYKIAAPCTHQEDCPLLVQSLQDWCHDRAHWTPPNWWQALEKQLPIKNNTLTFSYLVAQKSEIKSMGPEWGRLVGDQLKEKGKSRWMYCRGPQREFLSWLNKYGSAPELHRGDLLKTPDHEIKGNEIRIKPS